MIAQNSSVVCSACELKPSGKNTTSDSWSIPFLGLSRARGRPANSRMAHLFCHSCSQGSNVAAEAMACPLCGSDFIEFVQPQVQTYNNSSMLTRHSISAYMKSFNSHRTPEELMMWHAGAPVCSSTADCGPREAAGRSQWSAAQAVHNERPELECSPDDDACRSGPRGARRLQLPHGVVIWPGAAWRCSRVSALSWTRATCTCMLRRPPGVQDAGRGICGSC